MIIDKKNDLNKEPYIEHHQSVFEAFRMMFNYNHMVIPVYSGRFCLGVIDLFDLIAFCAHDEDDKYLLYHKLNFDVGIVLEKARKRHSK